MGGGIFFIFCLLGLARGKRYDESELSKTPKLFHLDDYEKCMAEKTGIYCLGKFLLYSEVENHTTYSLIEKYSKDPDLYNRSYIHRGYCVSSRCYDRNPNLTSRFEKCVDNWARHYQGLRARLDTLHYCQKSGMPRPLTPDTRGTAHRVFLYVILGILTLNAIGTIYDFSIDDKEKKCDLIIFWSVRKNWRSLSYSPPATWDNRMESFNGIKGLLMSWTPMYCHVGIYLTALYQRNPRFIENFLQSPAGPAIGLLTTATQAHMIIANYLTTQKILSMPNLGFKSLLGLFLKRVFRMLPVYLLVVGFAATWLNNFGDGPMWHMVETEGCNCRDKFWISAAFLQNMISPERLCLVQTWIMAVGMQLHLPALVLILFFKKHRRWANIGLSAIFVASLAATAHVAFKNKFVPMYTYMVPNAYQEFFYSSDSFNWFYMAPINCLMAAVAGVWLGFIDKDLQERGPRLKGKIWSFLAYCGFLAVFISSFYGVVLKELITDPWAVSAMIPVERIFYVIIISAELLLITNVDNALTALARWSPGRYISRIALAIAMIHWCVLGWFLANRYTVSDTSLLMIVQETITTFIVSCLVAFPLTLLVDLPVQKTMDRILVDHLIFH